MDEQKTQNQQTPQAPNKPYDIEPNMEAAMTYLIPIVGGVFVLLMEKNNSFTRFHAMQSVIFWLIAFFAYQVVGFLAIVGIGLVLLPLLSLAIFAIWLFLMWEAYNMREFELPYIGKAARNLINK